MIETYRALINLSLSLYPDQDHTEMLEMDLPDGPWVQFSYNGLRTQDGGRLGLEYSSEDGFWHGPAVPPTMGALGPIFSSKFPNLSVFRKLRT